MRKPLEATAGIEPACTDLQSAASPLRHVANCGIKGVGCPSLYRSESLTTILQAEPCVLSLIAAKEPAFRPAPVEDLDDRLRRRTPQHGGRPGPHRRRHRSADPSAMLEIPRENFVPPGAAGLAYLDLDLAVGEAGSRRLLKPMVLAKLIHAADIASRDRVLDVGCACRVCSCRACRISPARWWRLIRMLALVQAARSALAGQPNVTVVTWPATGGWPQGAPYDVDPARGRDRDRAAGLFKPTQGWGTAGLHSRWRSQRQGDALWPVAGRTRRAADFRCQRHRTAGLCQDTGIRLLICALF